MSSCSAFPCAPFIPEHLVFKKWLDLCVNDWATDTNKASFPLSVFCNLWIVKCPCVSFAHMISEVQYCWDIMAKNCYWRDSGRVCSPELPLMSQFGSLGGVNHDQLITDAGHGYNDSEWKKPKKTAVLAWVSWAVTYSILQSNLGKSGKVYKLSSFKEQIFILTDNRSAAWRSEI